jgi:acetylornithine deacetylase/succinyl-diaminopimelate desuccinylase-like protein
VIRRPVPAALAALFFLATSSSAQQPCTATAAACAELRALLQRPEVRTAFQHISENRARARQDVIALTQIPAPPFGEAARAAAYAELLRAAGADSVALDSVGNVVALRRGTAGGRTVAMGGHLDTVFPEGTDVTVRARGDTLFAPGIGDDSAGLVLVLEVLRALEHARIETAGDVLFLGTVGEEGLGDLRGVKHLFRGVPPRIDAFIAVDGGSIEAIVHQGLGSRRYRLTYHGPGGHSWGAFGAANPVHALGRAIARFDETAAALAEGGPRTSYNVGRIGGGTSVNSIPAEAWAEIDIRSEAPRMLVRADSLLQLVAGRALREENATARGTLLRLDLQRVGDRPGGETPVRTPLVQRAIAATELFGGRPVLGRSSTDANVPIALGVPAITIGRGGQGGSTHAPGEWWLDRDAHRAAQRALLILLAEAGASPPGLLPAAPRR